jgi:hypothetical protein
MVEFKIQLEDSFVQKIGYSEIDKHLQVFVKKIILKLAAKEALQDLETLDLENDKDWQVSRELAWQQEKHKYISGE